MPEPRLHLPFRSPLLAVLSLVAVLPGCLTGALWGFDPFQQEQEQDPDPDPDVVPAAHVHTELVSESVESAQGSVEIVPPVLVNGLWWRDGAGTPTWWLRPAVGADLAAAMLAEPSLCRIEHAHVDATRGYLADQVIADQALMELEVLFEPAAIGVVMPDPDISPAARAVLAIPRRNAFVFAADPYLYLPRVFRSCVQRLSAVDFGLLLDQPGDWTVESFVFVGHDGTPHFEPGLPAQPVPEGADDPDRPLLERLRILSDFDLLLKLRSGNETLVVIIRPDHLWLWSAAHAERGLLVHRSAWRLEPAVGNGKPRTGAVARTVPGELVLTQQQFREVQQFDGPPEYFGDGLPLWQKIALTPVTFALDLTVLLPINALLSWLNEDDEPAIKDVGRSR